MTDPVWLAKLAAYVALNAAWIRAVLRAKRR